MFNVVRAVCFVYISFIKKELHIAALPKTKNISIIKLILNFIKG